MEENMVLSKKTLKSLGSRNVDILGSKPSSFAQKIMAKFGWKE